MSLPAGAIPRPELDRPLAAQRVVPVECPWCKTRDVRYFSKWASTRYYRCRRCADPHTGEWSSFKVLEAEAG